MPIVRPDPYYLEDRQEGLHPTEYDFLLKTFYRGVDEPTIPQFKKDMWVVYYTSTKADPNKIKDIVSNLIKKEILSLSPNGEKIRLTDFGCEAFEDFRTRQEEWETKDIIQINEGKKEILISKGEKFKGLQSLKEILSLAEKEILVEDPYIGSNLLELIYEIDHKDLKINIITADKKDNKSLPSVITFYKAYSSENKNLEMRFCKEADLHERIIIIDSTKVYVFSSSTKDLGRKDSTIRLLDDVNVKIGSFKKKWESAEAI